MAHEFSIRFQPASGSKFVQAEAYVHVVSAVLEGLASLRAAFAPQLAEIFGHKPVYAGRDAAASPAVGALAVHKFERAALLQDAFNL